MPSKNAIKNFEPDTMYHVYNRGVDKRIIFKDEQDYAVFLDFLKYALLTDSQTDEAFDPSVISAATRFNFRRLGLSNEVDLVAFCLMPNHFHLLVYQHSIDGITKLMRSIATGYSMYFNKRYERKGTLFQGRYKASTINSDSYWDHISRYIHLNPIELGVDWRTYPRSSYRIYAGEAKAEWVKPGLVLDSFDSINNYERFVSEYVDRHEELKQLEHDLGV